MKLTAIIRSLLILSTVNSIRAQTTPEAVTRILQVPLEKPEVVRFQLLGHLLRHATPLQVPASLDAWTAQSKRMRKQFEAVIFHGWPREWITASPRFEQVESIAATEGYRIRKLRYEIVPGFWSTALLYEPPQFRGKAPAILNLLGHYRDGKAMGFEQKR